MAEQLKIQPRQEATFVAIASLLIGIVAVACAAIFVRISLREIGPIATISNRFWIAILPLSVWVAGERLLQPKKAPELLQPEEWALLLLAGVIAAVDLPLWAFSLSRTSVANAMVLSDLAPLFTTLGAWLLWRQRFDPRFLFGLAVSLTGAMAIGIGDIQLDPLQLFGDGAALLSALFLSAYLLTLERLRTRLSAPVILLSTSIIGAVITGAIALNVEHQLFPTSGQGWGAVIGLALVSQVLGQGLITYSLSRLSSGVVALSYLLEPVLSALGAWILFAETLSLFNATSFFIVILGVYIAISSPSAVKAG